jgi:drug/metabolite transporter (DMT)-like permease/outer membrane protein assembly factor BamB
MSRRAWGAFAAASIIWGVPYLFIRIAVRGGMTPLTLAWGRVTLAAVVLLALAWRAGVLGPIRRHLRWLALYAFVEVTVPFPLIAFGEQRVSSSLAAIVVASVPLIGAVLAFRFDHSERPTRLRGLGLLIGFGGVVALVGIDVAGRASELLGTAAILLAAVGYAIGPMVIKLRLGALDPRAAIGGALGIASLLLLPGALLDLPSRVPSAGAIVCVVVLGLLCTAAAFVILTVLIREAGTSRAMVITYVNPVVAVALGVALLGEQPGPGAVAGLLLILAGSWLSTGGRLPPIRRRPVLITGVLLVLVLPAVAGAATTAAWTTYRHDMQRSGIDPDSTSPVAPKQVWQTGSLDGPIYGSPLVFGSRVYVATQNDTVYALDLATGTAVWHQHLATAVPSPQLPCGNIDPTVGITSTPVIDPATRRIFVVADTWDGNHKSSVAHELYGLSVDTGAIAAGTPIQVDPPGSHPEYQLQRPGLALGAGRIVIGYGGNWGDCGENDGLYHGWVVSVPETGGALHTFEVAPASGGGAVWGAGNGLPIDGAGAVWAATGNSPGPPFGNQESVVKLSPDTLQGGLNHWAPPNWQSLDYGDTDLASSEPLLLPGGLVFQIGKEGVGYLLDASNLAAGPVDQHSVCSGGSYGGGIVINSVMYVTCTDGIRALALDATGKAFTPRPGWSVTSAAVGPPIEAGGLIWSAGLNDGTLYGLDPSTGHVVFAKDLGSFNHFATPAAGAGLLVVANGDRVTALQIAKTLALVTPPAVVPPPARPPSITGARLSGSGRSRTLRLTLSTAATVTAAVNQRVAGRRVRGRCRTGSHRGRRCTVTVRRRKFTLRAHAGGNTFRLRFARLRAGRYAVTLTAVDRNHRVSGTTHLSLTLTSR